MDANLKAAFDTFLADSQALVDAYMAKHFPKNNRKVLGFDVGRRYIRVYIQTVGQSDKSCHCFVDTTNGDVLKPDSWKKPARGARGNIYTTRIADPGHNPALVMPHY